MDIEDLIKEEDCVITFTAFGYVKRQKLDTYQLQHRGGRGVSGMARREEDVPTEMFITSTHDYVMFFSDRGRVYRLKGYEIPEGSRSSKGINIVNLLPLEGDEKITEMIRVLKNYEHEMYLVMVTRNGLIKRTALSEFGNIRKKGLIALSLRDDDSLVWTRLTNGSNELLVATKGGYSIRFNENDVRAMGRGAAGVHAIRLRDGDEVIGMSTLREGGRVLTVSETGYGRLTPISDYRLQSRGGMGIKNYRVENGNVAAIRVVDNDDDVIIINNSGVIIRIAVSEIRECARPSKGVRVMKIEDGGKVVALARVKHEEGEQTDVVDNTVEDEPSEIDSENPDEENIEISSDINE